MTVRLFSDVATERFLEPVPAPEPGWLDWEADSYLVDGAMPGPRGWLERVLGLPGHEDLTFAARVGLLSCYARIGVGVARVEFDRAGSGLAQSWQPIDAPPGVRHGAVAVVVPVLAGHVVTDLLALHPERPGLWASRTGDPPDLLGLAAADLGDWRAFRGEAPLRLCREPLSWLRCVLRLHLDWQGALRRAWPELVGRYRAAGMAERARLQDWPLAEGLGPEPRQVDAACLLRPELAEQLLQGLPGVVCDSPGHAAEIRDLLRGQRRARRAAEPALPECGAAHDVLRGAA